MENTFSKEWWINALQLNESKASTETSQYHQLVLNEMDEIERTSQEFNTPIEDLRYAFETGQETILNDDVWSKLKNTDSYKIKNLEQAIKLADKYKKDWKSILNAIKAEEQLPLPMVLNWGDGKYYLVAGNTRLMIYRALGLQPVVLMAKLDLKIQEGSSVFDVNTIKLDAKQNNVIKKFIKFAVSVLDLQNVPSNLTLSYDNDEAKERHSFGYFDPNTDRIWLYVKNRNLADILRTLAHELVHRRQAELGILDENSGQTGSPIENAANAAAGALLRHFGKENNQIFEHKILKEGFEEVVDKILKVFPEMQDDFIDIGVIYNKNKTLINQISKHPDGKTLVLKNELEEQEKEFKEFLNFLEQTINLYSNISPLLKEKVYKNILETLETYLDHFKKLNKFYTKLYNHLINPLSKDQLDKEAMSLLQEVSIEQLKTQFVDSGKISLDIFDKIVDAASNQGALATWLTSKVANKLIKSEDIYKFKEYFKTFNKYKNEFPFKDINQYKTANDVTTFIKKSIEIEEKVSQAGQSINTDSKSNLVSLNGIKELESVGIKFLGMVDGYQCFKIPTELGGNEQAFKIYRKHLAKCQRNAEDEEAKGIHICTMANQDYFDSYLLGDEDVLADDLYVFFNLNDPKSPYQFHYNGEQFMDKNDNNVV
jgi:hypothetical protein